MSLNRARVDRGKRMRAEWFAAHGPCRRCGLWPSDGLTLDHIDPRLKDPRLIARGSTTAIWRSFSHADRERELANCQPLCLPCHRIKTAEDRVLYGQSPHYRGNDPR